MNSAGGAVFTKILVKDLERVIAGLAASPTAVTFVDYLNMWGLTLIGLGLMLGLLTRTATVAGLVLLALYYIAAPPFVGYAYGMPSEGSYLIVNKVLIELAALAVLLVHPTARTFGLDRFFRRAGSSVPEPLEHAVREGAHHD